jgi:hypothetical protein
MPPASCLLPPAFLKRASLIMAKTDDIRNILKFAKWRKALLLIKTHYGNYGNTGNDYESSHDHNLTELVWYFGTFHSLFSLK